MVHTGKRQKLGIVNGKPAVITEPVYEPKMRSLTAKKLAELKQQRNRSLDELGKIAVKQVP